MKKGSRVGLVLLSSLMVVAAYYLAKVQGPLREIHTYQQKAIVGMASAKKREATRDKIRRYQEKIDYLKSEVRTACLGASQSDLWVRVTRLAHHHHVVVDRIHALVQGELEIIASGYYPDFLNFIKALAGIRSNRVIDAVEISPAGLANSHVLLLKLKMAQLCLE